MSDHRLTVDGTCTCGFHSHKVRSVRMHIAKANQTPHYHRQYVEGCFRCDLSRLEADHDH